MNKVIIGFLVLISFSSFGRTLTKTDYKKIKASVTKEASRAMMNANYIVQKLDLVDFVQIDITTDILNKKDIVVTKATILPSEDNCRCQDVFEVSMKIEKIENYWTVKNKSIKIKHILTDQ